VVRIERENAELQLLEALRHNRRKREQRRELLVEGVRAIDRCLASGWPVRAIVTPLGAIRSRWAQDVLDARPDTEHLELSPPLFARVADRDELPELLLVARLPPRDLAQIPRTTDGVVVLLDRPANPGNLGTIIRTADALGAAGVITVGHGAHLYDPRTIRASVGSLFALPVVPAPNQGALVDWLDGWRAAAPRLTVYATDETGEVRLDGRGRLTRPALVLLGSERRGLSRALRDLADATVAIPMAGSASSLNVAVAHGIVLHHLMSA
jgi:tRNA G18 (ribose-2'-O)-methylase SpoU